MDCATSETFTHLNGTQACLTMMLLTQFNNDIGALELVQSAVITSRFVENEENMTQNNEQSL